MNFKYYLPVAKHKLGFVTVLMLLVSFLVTLSACKQGESNKYVEAIEAGQLEIQGIRIETGNPIINADGYAQYTAFGLPIDSGAAEVDISNKVRWSISDDALATIDSNGLLQAKADGAVNVIAEFSKYSTSAVQEINTANLTAINITGVDVVVECQNLQLDAEGQFDDGTTRPISSQVTWSVTDGAATISTDGILRTVLDGVMNVTAESAGLVGEVDITVTPGLQTITLSPMDSTISKGSTLQFSALGSYASQQVDITKNSSWSSSDTTVATFNNQAEHEKVSAVGVGSTIIEVECGGEIVETTLTVTELATFRYIRIDGAHPVTVKETDGTHQLELRALYTDGSTKTVTEDANWSIESLGDTDLEISNISGSKGEITINPGKGTARIRADYENDSDMINVIVE